MTLACLAKVAYSCESYSSTDSNGSVLDLKQCSTDLPCLVDGTRECVAKLVRLAFELLFKCLSDAEWLLSVPNTALQARLE